MCGVSLSEVEYHLPGLVRRSSAVDTVVLVFRGGVRISEDGFFVVASGPDPGDWCDDWL